MVTWARAVLVRRCGSCGAFIPVGAPICRLDLPSQRPRGPELFPGRVVKPINKIRCEACAGPAPSDLPAAPVVKSGVEGPVKLHLANAEAEPVFDWRQRQAGSDDD